jgi:hypothetical protein
LPDEFEMHLLRNTDGELWTHICLGADALQSKSPALTLDRFARFGKLGPKQRGNNRFENGASWTKTGGVGNLQRRNPPPKFTVAHSAATRLLNWEQPLERRQRIVRASLRVGVGRSRGPRSAKTTIADACD